MFHDRRTRNENIARFHVIFKQNQLRKDRKSLIEQNKSIIDSLDNAINEHHNLLLSKYSDIFDENDVLVNTILDVFYPNFLRDKVRNIGTRYPLKDKKGRIKKDKYGNIEYKKFPKVIQSFSYDKE